MDFAYDGGLGQGGDVVLLVDDAVVATGRIERTVPIVYSMSGETFDVGIDTGAAVGPYPHHYPFTATIISVTLERLAEPSAETRAAVAAGRLRADLASQ